MTVEEALNELANDPRGVAETLQAEGIKGRKAHCRECPIAAFLDKKCGLDPSRRVKSFEVFYRQEGIPQVANMPLNVSNFILEFDSFGQHSELRLEA